MVPLRSFMFTLIMVCLVMVALEVYFLNRELSTEKRKTLPKPKKLFHQYSYMEMLERARLKIDAQFDGLYNVSLKQLVPEEGGQPIRCLIVSNWAAGGNLLASILNAIPGSYYHYEPLSHLGVRKLFQDENSHTSAEIDEVLKLMQDLLNCDYSQSKAMDLYLKYTDKDRNLFSLNKRLWELCEENWDYCKSGRLLSMYCRVFPIQLMKTTRLPLNVAKALLQRYAHNNVKLSDSHAYQPKLKVIYMLRDPRGIVFARDPWGRCAFSPQDCAHVRPLCANMVKDFLVAEELQRDYTNDFMVVSFEKLVMDMQSQVHKILTFLGLPYNGYVRNYINERTTRRKIGEEPIWKRSKNKKPVWEKHWSEPHKAVVEEYCEEALLKWGFERSEKNGSNSLGNNDSNSFSQRF